MLHDVRKPDSYVHHLMALSTKHEVKTAEDVLNQQGAIIIPKGRVLTQEITDRIISHKLIKPLEAFLSIEDGLDGEKLLVIYSQMLERNRDFQLFHQHLDLISLLKKACHYYNRYPLLIQKVTVLKERLPGIFKQALFSAYVGMAIAHQMRATDEDCAAVFVAGLVHDIGMLHIDPKIILKKGDYSAEEWRSMQAHTVVGHCILRYVDRLPKTIATAVLEHHERCDGSGYPMGKKSSELGMIGQIIGMTDTCLALYNRELKPKGLSFDALLPILQLNPDVYCRKVFTATAEIIREIPWEPKRVYPDEKMPELVSRLLLQNEAINHDYCVLYGIVTSLSQEPEVNRTMNNVVRMGERINRCLMSSGLLQAEHDQWMRSTCTKRSQTDYIAIERIEVMYAEVKWQLRQLKRMVFLLWKNHSFKNNEVRNLVRKGLLEIEQYHKLHDRSAMPMC